MGTVHELLTSPMYTESDAARLLEVPPSTLHYWLEGGTYRSTTYLPVLRREPTGLKDVTWGEFVEASLLRHYRRQLGVPLRELREFIGVLRDQLDVPYPLASARPWAAAGQLIVDAQHVTKLPKDLWLYAPVAKQPLLLPAAQAYLDTVEFDDAAGVVARLRPHSPTSPVVIDPAVRFGKPSVGGISTEVIAEYDEGGASAGEIGEEFGLLPSEVRAALAFQFSHAAA